MASVSRALRSTSKRWRTSTGVAATRSRSLRVEPDHDDRAAAVRRAAERDDFLRRRPDFNGGGHAGRTGSEPTVREAPRDRHYLRCACILVTGPRHRLGVLRQVRGTFADLRPDALLNQAAR